MFTNCGVVSCCIHFLRSVASRPRTPTTCLLCRLRTIRKLSCSFMFKICAFHWCSKYAIPIFVALALEVLANLRLFTLFLYHVNYIMNLTNYLEFSVPECVICLAYAWVGVSWSHSSLLRFSWDSKSHEILIVISWDSKSREILMRISRDFYYLMRFF